MKIPITVHIGSSFEQIEDKVRFNVTLDKKANTSKITFVLLSSQAQHVRAVMMKKDYIKLQETISELGFELHSEFEAITGTARANFKIV